MMDERCEGERSKVKEDERQKSSKLKGQSSKKVQQT
jgi:hypothetical protein